MSAFIQTYTGRQFFPFDPKPEDVCLEDIAHALALTCRFNGHCTHFYSVAQHSVLMARAAAPENKLRALMHDAAEAYVGDVVRPVKREIAFDAVEAGVEHAIAEALGLPFPVCDDAVKLLDNRILLDERRQLMAPAIYPGGWPDVEPLGVVIDPWSPLQAESAFLRMWDECQADAQLGLFVA